MGPFDGVHVYVTTHSASVCVSYSLPVFANNRVVAINNQGVRICSAQIAPVWLYSISFAYTLFTLLLAAVMLDKEYMSEKFGLMMVIASLTSFGMFQSFCHIVLALMKKKGRSTALVDAVQRL